jgi:hypothetical protein
MKPQIRILGIDDAPFKFSDKTTTVIGVVMRIPSYIEAVLRTEVEVDGTDATAVLTEMINRSRYKLQLKAVMLDGIALGGFNVVDIITLQRQIALPVITIARDKPNAHAIRNALKSHFKDWRRRWKLVGSDQMVELKTKHKPIYVRFVGISKEDVEELIQLATVRGALPEPIRVAHLIASALAVGESHGRA